MSDDEREQVGICYAETGQAAAIELGNALVSGELKQKRISDWTRQLQRTPEAVLLCFRGGLRSQTTQAWLREVGHDVPLVEGGYKALRTYLIEVLKKSLDSLDIRVIAGRTGSAKTALLNRLTESIQFPTIDLEGLAKHRGSAFGKRVEPQPSQIDFENCIAIELLKILHQGGRQVAIEDEGRLIGRCALPLCLQEHLAAAKVITIEASLEERVEHSWQNYILQNYEEHLSLNLKAEDAFDAFAESLKTSMGKISKRLGGSRYKALSALLESALTAHKLGDAEAHKAWIEILLRDYYDPMYDYQLKLKQRQVIFTGDILATEAFLAETAKTDG